MKKDNEVTSYRVEGNRHCIAAELLKAGVLPEDKYKTCGSHDALSVYANETPDGDVYYTAHCFSCEQTFDREAFAHSSHAHDFGIESSGVVVDKDAFEEYKKKAKVKKPLTKEDVKEIISYGYDGKLPDGTYYRGIKNEFRQFFGHAIKMVNGVPVAEWYPETDDGKMMGYKSRHFPKNFGWDNRGSTGIDNDFSGQVKFKDQNFRDILIVGGEIDKASAYQMWVEYQRTKAKRNGNQNPDAGEYAYMPVVSPTTGEGSIVRQIRKNYDFICSAENIYLALDNDERGIESMEEACKILPKEKIRIVRWSRKDPNNYIHNPENKDYSKQFISDFYAAKEYEDSGIFASNGLMPFIKEALNLERIPLPHYMQGLQAKTKGDGLIKNRIYNLIGITSCGKSTHVNAMVYHFAFLPNEVTAVISLEATKGEYGIDILSLHLEKNLYWEAADDVQAYLDDPEVVAKANELFMREDGAPRFYIVDDRRGTVSSLESLCETLKNKYGVTIIVIDVLTDLLRVTNNEDQAKHLNWQSNFVKSGVTIINVLHTRKLPPSTNGVPVKATEFDAYGSSIFVQKAAGNFVINRNKEAPEDDWIERNTTYPSVPKLRQGDTGECTPWLYDPETRKSYDRDEFFAMHPEKLPVGYDLTISSFDKEYWEEGGRGFKGTPTEGGSSKKKFRKVESSLEPIMVGNVAL